MTVRERYRTRGSYYLFARKAPEALKEFAALVEAFPADSTGLANLALAQFQQRDMTEALRAGPQGVGHLSHERAAGATTSRSMRCTPASSTPPSPRATR